MSKAGVGLGTVCFAGNPLLAAIAIVAAAVAARLVARGHGAALKAGGRGGGRKKLGARAEAASGGGEGGVYAGFGRAPPRGGRFPYRGARISSDPVSQLPSGCSCSARRRAKRRPPLHGRGLQTCSKTHKNLLPFRFQWIDLPSTIGSMPLREQVVAESLRIPQAGFAPTILLQEGQKPVQTHIVEYSHSAWVLQGVRRKRP